MDHPVNVKHFCLDSRGSTIMPYTVHHSGSVVTTAWNVSMSSSLRTF